MNRKERKLEHKAIRKVGKYFNGAMQPMTKEQIKSNLRAETEFGKHYADWRAKEYG